MAEGDGAVAHLFIAPFREEWIVVFKLIVVTAVAEHPVVSVFSFAIEE